MADEQPTPQPASADEQCKQLAYGALREGAYIAASSSLTDEEIQSFVAACLIAARAPA